MTVEKIVGMLFILGAGAGIMFTGSLWFLIPLVVGVLILWYNTHLGDKVYKIKED